jgi:hypothetical protein
MDVERPLAPAADFEKIGSGLSEGSHGCIGTDR